ncbi:MAG: CRISPR-associated endoribonuclease Cas6 [Lachnospiraceae bacterium]|nr:CRISPR-associated endoribonuclease Cas6 [Lachnospiraceae bacterium]
MKLKIYMKNSDVVSFPLNYNYQFMSAIYRLISRDTVLSDFLHNEGYQSCGKSFKLFVFSPIRGDYTIVEKSLVIYGDIWIEIRSPSSLFIEELKSRLFETCSFKLFDHTFEVKLIELYDRPLMGNSFKIKTISPIVARRENEGKSVYFSPSDTEFDKLVNLNLYGKYTAAYGEEPPSTVDLTLIGMPKKVVTKFKGIWITAYHATFDMAASAAVADLLYNSGLGNKNSQGFGMFEVL